MKSVRKVCSYSIKKLKGCFYKVTLYDRNNKKLFEITETPRFWLLFSQNVKKAIAEMHLLPPKK